MGDSKWLGFFIPPSTVVDITRRQLTTTLPQARGESNDSWLETRTAENDSVKHAAVTIGAETSERIESPAGPAQRTARHARFIETLAVIPFGADVLLGLPTLRLSEETINSSELEAEERAARLLAAVRERESLRKYLLERKLVERAKGILQRRGRLSEEQAYRVMRNNSRRRGVPMANLAKEIIQASLQRRLLRNCPMG
jgi:hypothetical protein